MIKANQQVIELPSKDALMNLRDSYIERQSLSQALSPNGFSGAGCKLPAYLDTEETLLRQRHEESEKKFLANQIVSVTDLQEKMHWYQERLEDSTSTLFCPAAAQVSGSGNFSIVKNETGCSYLHLLLPQDQVQVFNEHEGAYFGSEGMEVEDDEEAFVEIGCKILEVNKVLKDGSTRQYQT